MKSGLRSGQLIKWKDDKGFGFIQPSDGNQEIFLHISDLQDVTRRPRVGDTIFYRVVTGNDGKPRAGHAFISGARRSTDPTYPKAIFNVAWAAPFPWLEIALLSMLPFIGAAHFAWTMRNPIPLLLYPVMGGLTFVLYADDKSRAQRGTWRRSEQQLHLCELAGGWLGAFVAQRQLRHKSSKTSYQMVFWAIVALHYVAWLSWLFWQIVLVKK